MSSLSEYNSSYVQYYLYWAGHVNSDPALYPDSLFGLSTPYYDEASDYYDCKDWIPSYPKPTTDQLLLYTLAEVSSWYNDFYVAPKSIAIFQYYQISTAALARVRTSPSMIGYKVFDIDTRTEKRFNGSSWVDS